MTALTGFTYKNSPMDNQVRLFHSFNEIGFIKINGISGSSFVGMLKGATYAFESKGIMSSDFDVFDTNRQLVASMRCSNWTSKVTVSFEGRVLIWKPVNFFYTKWELIDQDGVVVNVDSSFNKGNLFSTDEGGFLPFLVMFLKLQYSRKVSYVIMFVVLAQTIFRL